MSVGEYFIFRRDPHVPFNTPIICPNYNNGAAVFKTGVVSIFFCADLVLVSRQSDKFLDFAMSRSESGLTGLWGMARTTVVRFWKRAPDRWQGYAVFQLTTRIS